MFIRRTACAIVVWSSGPLVGYSETEDSCIWYEVSLANSARPSGANRPFRQRQVRPMTKRTPFLALAALAASPAYAQVQADPAGSSPILSALNWVQGTLLGNVATSAAVIAIAVVGFLMLTGRIEWRRGLVVVVGAFIIFGAVSIVAGIRSLAGGL